jgi:hypothetical protein
MQRHFFDWGGNIAGLLLVLAVNGLSGALPLNGQTMPEISAKYPSLFTPAGFTFSIWGLIYLSLVGFVIYQALPGQRGDSGMARISGYFKLNCLANASWLFAWHYDQLWISLVLMAAILLTLVAIYRALGVLDVTAGLAQQWLVQFPFGLYTGWITVATIANLSAVQIAMGWDDLWFSAISWTQLKMAFAGAVAATVILRRGDMAFVLVVAWAAFGISARQADTPEVAGAAWMLVILALLLVLGEVLRRLRAALGW